MDARHLRAALLVALLPVFMGAQYRTANFIVETPDPRLAKEIGQAAERFRHDLAVEWLGKPIPDWSQRCVMTVRRGPNLGAGGATSFVFDRGEVFGWRMTIQGSHERLLDSVLPHEINHMIFACHFRQKVPRWADEGAATIVEHVSERNRHRRMLVQFLRNGQGIPFNRMFAMKEYPADVMPLYAQGYSLAEYLIQRGGKRRYIAFLGDAMESDDWAAAIERHYGVPDAGALQKTWLAWVRVGSPALKPQRNLPLNTTPATLVADNGRRSRPAPVVFRIPKRPEETVAPDPGVSLASSGWRAAGSELPSKAVATVPAKTAVEPIRTQLTHPQAPQRVRPTYWR